MLTGRVSLALFAYLLSSLALAAEPNSYPAKPIQVVVPYGPGGAVDIVGRIITEHMVQTLGQPVVIQNRPGADANIGPAVVAQAAPDGYTLLASSSATVVNPLLERNLSWSTRDFVPIARFAHAPSAVVVPASSKLATLNDLVLRAKASPELLSAGVAGLGSPQTISTENFAQAAGIRFLYVPYKGGVSYIPDLVSGTLSMLIAPTNVIFQLVESGRLTALATTGDRRSPVLPDVPTMAESGYSDATAVSWYGLHAPVGTPAPVIKKLAQAVRSASDDPHVRERIAAIGAEIAYLDAPAFELFLNGELAKAQKYVELIRTK